MTVESIMNTIHEQCPDLDRAEVRAVATDILYSGEPVHEILGKKSLLDKLISGYQTRQSATARRVAAEDPNICPICKQTLKPVKLAEGRKAVFCAKHFVVYPVRPEKPKEEEDGIS
jgi:hypothetical protein